jgi:hypothetical protein
MTTSDLSIPMLVDHTAPSGLPTVAEHTDDPLTLLYQYQQQMRAELLGTATDSATCRSAWWQRLSQSAAMPRFAVTAARAIESRAAALTDIGGIGTHRHAVSFGTGAR